MSATITASNDPQVDHAVKARHRATWALGDYPKLAAELIATLGPILVEAAGVRAGQRVLDVAAGSGNAAIPAARAGATVVASDLTPELFDAGRALAAQHGVEISWQEADAENLPYVDGSFDTVLSCVGVMFAPNHDRSASELLRVCRTGGTIGLISWTPQGFVGELFATMKPFAAAPPPGALPPPLWGDEAHLRRLFGDRVIDVTVEHRTVEITRFATPGTFRDYFATKYGPTVAAYRNAAATNRVPELDAALDEVARKHTDARGVMAWEYLLVTARTC